MSNGNSDAVFKVLDFAGGTVVHINAGVAGLMCAICLGKRKDMGPGRTTWCSPFMSAPQCSGSAGSALMPARPSPQACRQAWR